ncbi:uncharacterized protein A4U43_C03F10340 [Asparagus officinalis]|uniref:Uncharacterized protein n=2 Tax=Asparagus officinalis TaxID=4686 RepID=A0A5P1FBM6_ASPOF|nr:uncharacterized protein A4U43_C03F10340 [Asparagus officinalis]
MPAVRECAFSFSPENIKKLKARANKETGCDGRISSFQALLAHVWRSVSRARALKPDQETCCWLQIGCRSRLSPPLPEAYVGNSIHGVTVKAFAGEVESNGLGWAALRLNQAIAEGSDRAGIYRWLESWNKRRPSFMTMDQFISSAPDLYLSSSPRFDVYGNDFGWGKPVAVRSGPGNKVDGKFTVYPTAEEGGIAVEICSTAEVLSSLLRDVEFLEVVA